MTTVSIVVAASLLYLVNLLNFVARDLIASGDKTGSPEVALVLLGHASAVLTANRWLLGLGAFFSIVGGISLIVGRRSLRSGLAAAAATPPPQSGGFGQVPQPNREKAPSEWTRPTVVLTAVALVVTTVLSVLGLLLKS